MARTGWILAVFVVPALLLGGCDSDRKRGLTPTGPTSADGITVESATLETIGDPLNAWSEDFGQECHVHGFLRNDGPRDVSVTLYFAAFDPKDRVIARATSPHNVVPAGGRAAYRAKLLAFESCKSVHRFEITRIEIEPV